MQTLLRKREHGPRRISSSRRLIHRAFGRAGLSLLALSVAASAQAQSAPTNICAATPALATQLRERPSDDSYAALVAWFDQNHEPQCAAETIHAGLKLEPTSARLNFLLAQRLSSAGKNLEAVAALQQAILSEPGALAPHLLLAVTFERIDRHREAREQWLASLKIDPASTPARDGMARSLIAAGDFNAAIQILSSAPRDETLTLDLATAYRRAGMYDETARTLSDGLKAQPGSDALTAALVSLDVDESHFEAASSLAETTARARPDDLEAQRIYLRTLVITGNNEAAKPLGRELLARAPHDADLLNLNGLLEQKAGELIQARKHLEEAVALSPNDYNPRVNLGVVLADLKVAAGARRQFEKAIALGTDEPQVHFELAKVLRTLGETQAAQRELALYQKRLKEQSDQAEAVAKATEAAQAVKAGDNQKAAALYRQACSAQPQNAALAYRLATVLDDLGDRDGERAALQQAIKADPHFAAAQYQLGYMDFQAGDNARAEREFRATVEALPDNVQAWISLAAVLGAESRFDEARAAVAHALELEPRNAAASDLRGKLSDAQSRH